MPVRHGSSDRKYAITPLRHSRRRTTTRPSASTPWTWNQCLARSKPIVIICMADGSFKRLLTLGRPRFPIGAARTVPRGGEADLVRVGVLYISHSSQSGRLVTMRTHRPSVVLSVQSEASKADFSEKRLDDLGCLVKGVGELHRIGHV